MNLHDPARPRINHKPAFLPHGRVIIHQLQIWPLPNGMIEVSLMLPVIGQTNISKYYHEAVLYDSLQDWIKEFAENPENLVKCLFGYDVENYQINSINEGRGKPPGDGDISQLDLLELL